MVYTCVAGRTNGSGPGVGRCSGSGSSGLPVPFLDRLVQFLPLVVLRHLQAAFLVHAFHLATLAAPQPRVTCRHLWTPYGCSRYLTHGSVITVRAAGTFCNAFGRAPYPVALPRRLHTFTAFVHHYPTYCIAGLPVLPTCSCGHYYLPSRHIPTRFSSAPTHGYFIWFGRQDGATCSYPTVTFSSPVWLNPVCLNIRRWTDSPIPQHCTSVTPVPHSRHLAYGTTALRAFHAPPIHHVAVLLRPCLTWALSRHMVTHLFTLPFCLDYGRIRLRGTCSSRLRTPCTASHLTQHTLGCLTRYGYDGL